MKTYSVLFNCGHGVARWKTMPMLAPRVGDVTRCKKCERQVTVKMVVDLNATIVPTVINHQENSHGT